MIKGFRHKGLAAFHRGGTAKGVSAFRGNQLVKLAAMLDRLDIAVKPEDMNLAGWRFHALSGNRAGSYAVSISGNWRLTFRFDGEDADDIDLEDYH